jgi:predicted nucleic acid-binding protein
MRVHLDTDFLIYALAKSGRERKRMRELADSDAILQMSVVAWYEFARGPRTPEQLAVARSQLAEADGVVELSEALAVRAADVFRALGSPRKRAADVVIGVTAASLGAILVTRNRRDFADIPDLVLDVVAG